MAQLWVLNSLALEIYSFFEGLDVNPNFFDLRRLKKKEILKEITFKGLSFLRLGGFFGG